MIPPNLPIEPQRKKPQRRMSADEARVQMIKILLALLALSFFIPWSVAVLNALVTIVNKP